MRIFSGFEAIVTEHKEVRMLMKSQPKQYRMLCQMVERPLPNLHQLDLCKQIRGSLVELEN